jgi:DNA polymerase III delta prime subunit
VADVVFSSADVKAKFAAYVEKKTIPNLLFYGSPGTGKSSISSALLTDLLIDPDDILRVNCSKDKIDALRDRVDLFSRSMPRGELKIVQLEELDGMSLDGQRLLKTLVEDVSEYCRFIATCNEPHKIIPPIKSRFTSFHFAKPDFDQVFFRLADILIAEQVSFTPEDFDKIIQMHYPDIRQTIQALQDSSISGALTINTDTLEADWKPALLNALSNSDWQAARQVVCSSLSKEDLPMIYPFLFTALRNHQKFNVMCKIIAEYQYRSAFVADPEIQLAAMFFSLADC